MLQLTIDFNTTKIVQEPQSIKHTRRHLEPVGQEDYILPMTEGQKALAMLVTHIHNYTTKS